MSAAYVVVAEAEAVVRSRAWAWLDPEDAVGAERSGKVMALAPIGQGGSDGAPNWVTIDTQRTHSGALCWR